MLFSGTVAIVSISCLSCQAQRWREYWSKNLINVEYIQKINFWFPHAKFLWYIFYSCIYSLNECIMFLIPSTFLWSLSNFFYHKKLSINYPFLILCAERKLKCNRNFKIQNEINSACVRGLTRSHRILMVRLYSNNYCYRNKSTARIYKTPWIALVRRNTQSYKTP